MSVAEMPTPRRCPRCDGSGSIYDRGSPAVRIDSLRTRAASTVGLLEACMGQLEDIHEIAYNRDRAQAERVAGGQRDYALDTHGDPRARAVYRDFALVLTDACELLAERAHDLLAVLRHGETSTRRIPISVTGVELAAVLVARNRRVEEGVGYTPRATIPQLGEARALAALEQANKQQDTALTKLRRQVKALGQEPIA